MENGWPELYTASTSLRKNDRETLSEFTGESNEPLRSLVNVGLRAMAEYRYFGDEATPVSRRLIRTASSSGTHASPTHSSKPSRRRSLNMAKWRQSFPGGSRKESSEPDTTEKRSFPKKLSLSRLFSWSNSEKSAKKKVARSNSEEGKKPARCNSDKKERPRSLFGRLLRRSVSEPAPAPAWTVRDDREFVRDQEVEDPDAGEQRYAPPSLEHLQKSTRFTRKEIKSVYVAFKQECPAGTVNPEKFRELVAQFFPLGDATVFCRLLFQLLDQDADDVVTFEQFLCSMSVMFRGSLEEKLRWAFNLYDLDGDGYLSVQEIMHVGKAVFDLLGKHTEPAIQEDSIEAHIVRVYAKMDVDGDGIVTFDQFKHACMNDGAVIKNLFVFNF